MTITKITTAPQPIEEVQKINEIIDNTVDLTSTQTITGTKTIEKNTVNPDSHLILKNTAMETTYGQTSTGDVAVIAVQDTSGTERGAFFTYQGSDYTACGIRTKGSDTHWKEFEIRAYNDGKVVASTGTDVKRSISEWAFPNSAVTNLTLGSSGTEYTASDTGYVSIDKRASGAGQYVAIGPSSGASQRLQGSYTGYTSGCECWAWLSVKKGDKFKVFYTTGGNTEWFRFIKAYGVA